MNYRLEKLLTEFAENTMEWTDLESLHGFLKKNNIDIERHGYDSLTYLVKNFHNLFDFNEPLKKIRQKPEVSHLNLKEKPLDKYIGEVYYIDNLILRINNSSTTHHPAAIFNVENDMLSPIRFFSVSQGTASINPRYRHKYILCSYTNFDKPTYFDRSKILYKAIKFTRYLIEKKYLPKWFLDERDLKNLQEHCTSMQD